MILHLALRASRTSNFPINRLLAGLPHLLRSTHRISCDSCASCISIAGLQHSTIPRASQGQPACLGKAYAVTPGFFPDNWGRIFIFDRPIHLPAAHKHGFKNEEAVQKFRAGMVTDDGLFCHPFLNRETLKPPLLLSMEFCCCISMGITRK